MTRTITNNIEDEEARQEIHERCKKLIERYKNQIVYQEVTDKGEKRRPLVILRHKRDADYVKRECEAIDRLHEAIITFSCKAKTQLPKPRLAEDVVLVNIYENRSVSSRTENKSRKEILKLLRGYCGLAIAYNEDGCNDDKIKNLNSQINYFKKETEENYRYRSIYRPDVIAKAIFCNGDIERIRVTIGGLFVFNADGEGIRAIKPQDRLTRKKRHSLYDNIEPVKHQATLKGFLYRESDVVAEKKRVGYDQEQERAKYVRKQGKSDLVKTPRKRS